MKYTWKYDTKNEIDRYVFTAGDIAKGIFGKGLFYVLPTLPESNEYKTAVFPDLKTLPTAIQWTYFKENNFYVPTIYTDLPNKHLIETKIEEYFSNDEINFETTKNLWESKSIEFESFLNQIFPKETSFYTNVYIYPTKIGTIGSYMHDKRNKALHIYLREDASTAELAKLIILGIISINSLSLTKNFSDIDFHDSKYFDKKMVIVDFLFLTTRLREMFPEYIPSIFFSTKEGNAKLAEQSKEYLRKLGFDNHSPFISEEFGVRDTITNKLLPNFSRQEELVLKLLVNKFSQICTYDDIAEAMWGDNYAEKFSLYHLNKIMHHVRTKLKVLGYQTPSIETKRSVGYILI